ncbi:unnamed protein product [Ostreobium quekettii]|uniref:CRAL-TRIO domain-containing protein n=1 Tax=Ostreobium quekettii TaxID=121088 RepID=A0A8S1IZQ6_9CHLO|nr:unnamed protein product [Ostreobium quekettii]|eukprot:evm.model.scf_68EXC.2 EVM.evm.TU.scf_68EXC.2   scf_68EXC:40114-47119(+)
MPSAGTWDGPATHRRNSSRSRGMGSIAACGPARLVRRYPAPCVRDDWGKMPDEQDDLVYQLRDSLMMRNAYDPEEHDFALLLRFLRAREYDVDRATRMMMDMLQWRQENRVDHILDEFHFAEREEFLSIFPQGYHKTDKQGHPVYVQHLGNINLTRILEVTTEERMLKYHIQEYERCLKYIFPVCSKVWGKQIDATFAIVDVKGVGFYHMTKEVRSVLARLTKVDSDNYPETLYHTCIINAPTTFRAIWAIVKPMLNKRTQGKIEVCPRDFLPSLRKWINDEDIPEYLGGKSKGTLIDDVGPWRSPELVKEVEVERLALMEGDASARSLRRDEWTPTRQSSTLSSATVFEDAEDRVIDDIADEDGNAAVGPVDPPAVSEPALSAGGTPRRAASLAARIRSLEAGLPEHVSRLREVMKVDEKEQLKYLSSAPPRSLIGRVEVLEEGMELLLTAQERSWEMENPGQPRCSLCACCSIM